MRALPLVVPLALVAIVGHGSSAYADAGDVARARVLDQQGVRAYREERYNDAIRYFTEAYKLGGPPSELWNIVKCHLRLDEPETAAKTLDEYLGLKGLTASDRAEAEAQLHELQRRHSTLTVASSPAGANVFLDGRHPAGTTPATIDVPPGSHAIAVEHPGYERYERDVDAKFGRAIIVEAQLTRGDGPTTPPPPASTEAGAKSAPVDATRPHRLFLEAELGAMFPRYGSFGGTGNVAGFLSVAWAVVEAPRAIVTIGLRATLTGDSWSNTVSAPAQGAGCSSALPNDFGATALSAFVAGGAAWRATPRLRIGGDLGLGFATLETSQVGGDLFAPSCSPSPGVKPAIHLGAEGSWSVSRDFRVIVSPLVIELAPSFDGVREAPKDASGMWVRFGAGVGLAFDVL